MTRSAELVLAAAGALFVAACSPYGTSPGGGSIFGGDRYYGCTLNNNEYANGAAICRGGVERYCDNGRWVNTGNSCGDNVANRGCTFNGRVFADGKASCQNGERYRCNGGQWMNTGRVCGNAQQQARTSNSCRFNNQVIAPQSTICRQGRTYRCENGQWRNLRVACR
ncbi:MAG: hypothetical protein AB7V27_16910 [Candidatus Binatia bacterium]